MVENNVKENLIDDEEEGEHLSWYETTVPLDRGMEFCFMKGFEMGTRVMKSALEDEMMEGVKP